MAHRQSKRTHPTRTCLEALESRTLLSAAALPGGNLAILPSFHLQDDITVISEPAPRSTPSLEGNIRGALIGDWLPPAPTPVIPSPPEGLHVAPAERAPAAPQPSLTNLRATFLSRTHDTIKIKITYHDDAPPAPGADVLYAASLLVDPGVIPEGVQFGYQSDSTWSTNADGDIDVIVTLQSAAFADDQAYTVWTLEAWRQITTNGESTPGPLVFGNSDLVIPPVGGFPAPTPGFADPVLAIESPVIDLAPIAPDAPVTTDTPITASLAETAPTPAAPLPLTRETLRQLFGDAYDAWATGRSTGNLLADVRSFLADHPDAAGQPITIDATTPAWSLKKLRIKRVTLPA